ncbi:MAG TPA: 30S ribosomal protein S1 [Candidatus Limnocylindrales bacterium]|nr:30S ribosomal protein S1 [Candidatus Limnocylindrales bacterium]
MTEEQQGGTAPVPEAIAPEPDQAPENTVGTVAVADEPAAGTTDFTEETQAPDVTAAESDGDPAASSVDAVAAPDEPEAPAEAPAGEESATADVSTNDTSPAETATLAEAPSATDAPAETPAATDADAADAPSAEAAAAPAATDADAADAPSAEAAAAPPADAAEAPTVADATSEAPAAEEAPPAPPRDLGPEPTTMEELLAEQDSDIKSFKHGDVVEGTVVRIDKDEILVDIGAKSEGVVSNRELYGRHAESQPQLTIGDTVLVYVLQPESQEGHAVLSLRRAGLERKWRSMQEQFEAGLIIEAPVIDHNKGGLIVDCGIRGFVPISQIVDFPRRPQNDQPRDAAQEIAEKLMPFVGRKLRLKILEVNRKANRLILSEKVALYEERREKRDELFSSLQVGQKVTGTVRSIAPFGVFIDLGGIDGLVHKSELSWNKVNNPEAGYKVGDEVEAEVIDINHERGRISLSIRRLQPDPWHSTVADFKVGDVIDGTVTKLVNFGAFVRVRDGLEGLIHISELSHQRVAHPGDVVHEGQQLKLKIISLDSERHRLGLSLKQAEEPPVRSMPEPGPSAGPRERRPRPERSYSMSDAVQEPEGGIDNTLAAAFAQVRDQLAASEEAAAGAAEVEQPSADAPMAEAAPAAVETETAADGPEAGPATAEAETAEAEPATAEAPTAEPAVDAEEAAPEPEPAIETEAQPEVEAQPEAEAEAPAAHPEAPAEEPAVEASPAGAESPVDIEAAVAPDEVAEPDAPAEVAEPDAPADDSEDAKPA